jgi:hypothetical protein
VFPGQIGPVIVGVVEIAFTVIEVAVFADEVIQPLVDAVRYDLN